MQEQYTPTASKYTVMMENIYGDIEEVTSTYFKEGAFFYAEQKNLNDDECFYYVASDRMDRSYPEQLAQGIDMGLTRAGISGAFDMLGRFINEVRYSNRRDLVKATLNRLKDKENFSMFDVEEAILNGYEDVMIDSDEGGLLP